MFVMEKEVKTRFTRDLLTAIFAFVFVVVFPTNWLFSDSHIAYVFSWILRSLFCLFVLWLDHRGKWQIFQWEKGRFQVAFLLPFLLGCFSNFLYAFVARMIPSSESFRWALLGWSIGNSFFVVLSEEMLFRGFLFKYSVQVLDTKSKPFFTAIVLATAFALFHLINLLSGNVVATLVQVAYAWVLGFLLTTVLLWTRSLLYPILGHLLFNLANQTFFTAIYDGNRGFNFYLFSMGLSVVLLVYAAFLLRKPKAPSKQKQYVTKNMDTR